MPDILDVPDLTAKLINIDPPINHVIDVTPLFANLINVQAIIPTS